jgi:DNA polymerase I-like protein with 3'-5' exonuclease and polymerase domains
MFEAQKEWVCPDDFPDLTRHKYIAIDLETKDPGLKSRGSGSVFNDGEIVGIAVAVEGWSAYYPIAHEGGGNLEKEKVLAWVKNICANGSTKIFHNAMYDVCWLRAYGITINGYIVDTMVMASLIDENRLWYSLNSVSFDYLGETKSEEVLTKTAESWGIDPKSEMYKLPAMYVGSYAEKDAELTLKLYKKLSLEIPKQKLEKVLTLETELFPCLVDMKFKGVRVDVERAHLLKKDLIAKEQNLILEIKNETGIEVQLMAARSVAAVFDKLGLLYERTDKSNAPSFTKNFLQEHKHPIVQKIAKARELNKSHSTFIDSILRFEHYGRIHADINPIRSDQGGTVTGRFSYSNPNLQQIPARNKDLGPMIRGLFLPERDHKWGCFDYSQQEPRLVVHYAATTQPISFDESVIKIVERFKNNTVDFHQTVAEMAGISRSQAKTINLGLFYGMGKAKLQAELGLSTKQEAEKLFKEYHNNVPFVKDLMNYTSDLANSEGYIATIGGRRCRFNKWELNEFNPGVMSAPMSTEEEAKIKSIDKQKQKIEDQYKYKIELNEMTEEDIKKMNKTIKELEPKVKRCFTYKALNKLIQGSAADMTKQAMLNLYKEGIVPHIQIHDELDISVRDEQQAARIVEIMENAVKLAIPNKVDYESGETWGDIYG